MSSLVPKTLLRALSQVKAAPAQEPLDPAVAALAVAVLVEVPHLVEGLLVVEVPHLVEVAGCWRW